MEHKFETESEAKESKTNTSHNLKFAMNLRGKLFIADQLLNSAPIDHSLIATYMDYESIYKVRHDLIHSIICDSLSLRFGEITVENFINNNNIIITNNQYYEDVKNQTPDYLGYKAKSIEIMEITVSLDPKARKRKAAKYALLVYFFKLNGYSVNYQIIVINPSDVYLNRVELNKIGVPDYSVDLIKTICQQTNKLLYEVHKRVDGASWNEIFFKISKPENPLEYTINDVYNTFDEYSEKPFHDKMGIYNSIFETSKTLDDGFINHCVSLAEKVDCPILVKEEFDEKTFVNDLKLRSNSTHLRSIFPLPYIQMSEFKDSSIRSTETDYIMNNALASCLIQSHDQVLQTIGEALGKQMNLIAKKSNKTNDDFLFYVRYNDLERSQIALEGPGRKKFLNQGSTEHIIEDERHTLYALDPDTNVSELDRLSFAFSDKNRLEENKEMMVRLDDIIEMKGFSFDYLKIVQSIYREVNINSMRLGRKKKHIIKPTGIHGVFVLLYPGTKLRAGELANIVWFKVLILNEMIYPHEFNSHWAFKRITRDKLVSHSRWLSCDVHRLDHYIRCYDKILMAYVSMINLRYKLKVSSIKRQDNEEDIETFTLTKLINEDNSNALGLIMMTYLEDRRTTSKFLQNIRYLVMTSISLFPKYDSVFSKMKDAIRSPLQLYYLNKSLEYYNNMKQWSFHNNLMLGSVKFDNINNVFIDTLGGSIIRLPRPIITDRNNNGEFSEILFEMYFSMLFNKNQDDPTHASFQVLEKIVDGENHYNEVKWGNAHLGYRNGSTDNEFASEVIDRNEVHCFSKKAIETGSILLSLVASDPNGDRFLKALQQSNVNKTLDQFATYKSSSRFDSKVYVSENHRQNSRTRCIEQSIELQKDCLYTSFDVCNSKYRQEDTFFQVFKKNQIGGVREILILPITNRIRINVLETISRNICQTDPREVLTHGDIKFDKIKSALYSSKKYPGKRLPLHLTFDKSKWGPSFVPIQFLYMFTPYSEKMGSMIYFIADLLIRHQNKLCIYPEKLVNAWHRDPENKLQHRDYPILQLLKEKFLEDKQLYMKNCSNMGQGILHFTSSLLHLCLISFRDEIYKRLCKKHSLDYEDHEDLLSSDDSYTIFCPEVKKGNYGILCKKIILFFKAQEVSERLFNCRTSMAKSSINPLIGEFNSLFISNMTFIPTLIKFALASVHPVNTDSFYRMVKECYSSSRQIVENGGSLELYLLSSKLNKIYCESIYHSHDNGINTISEINRENIPYHLGNYPIFDPALMISFGPEYYNYKIYKTKWTIMNDTEKRLFISSHKFIKGGLTETMAEFEDGDTVLGGLLRIEAKMGPIAQLELLKKRAGFSNKDISDMLVNDPLLVIRRPVSPSEILFKTVQKLYTKGASEAMKSIAASIYYGRVSATVSAGVFYIPNGNTELKTYKECLESLLQEDVSFNIDEQIRFIYPKHKDYEIFLNRDYVNVTSYPRNSFEIQTIQSLSTHRIYTKLTQPVSELLEYKWMGKIIPPNLETKVNRDFEIMKIHYPMLKDTLEETLNVFSGDKSQKTKGVLLLILKLFSLRDRSFKGVLYGFGSGDITETYRTLIERNLNLSTTSQIDLAATREIRKYHYYEKIYAAYNQMILARLNIMPKKLLWDEIEEDEINQFLLDRSININVKKRIFMLAVSTRHISEVEEWSGRVKIPLHVWNLKQRLERGVYTGSFDLCVFMGSNVLNVIHDEEKKFYGIWKTKFDDPTILFTLLEEASQLLQYSIEELTGKLSRGKWIVDVREKKVLSAIDGFRIDDMRYKSNLPFESSYLDIDDEKTRLKSYDGYTIYSMDTGLLDTNFTTTDDNYDFPMYGMSFKNILNMGSISTNFNLMFVSRKESFNALEDLKVDKPKITNVTKERLDLFDWDTKYIEEKTDDLELTVTGDQDDSDFDVSGFLVEDKEEVKEALKTVNATEDLFSQFMDLLDYTTISEAYVNMKTTYKIQQSRRIFTNIKNLKYQLIAHHLLLDFKINKLTIKKLKKMFEGETQKYVYYSLVSLYDRTYSITDAKSPRGLKVDISEEFFNKFD